MSYAERIHFLRKSANLTQNELAKLIGIKRHTIGDWETNRSEPNIENLITLANFFNVSINFILGLDEINYNQTIDFDVQKKYISFMAENETVDKLFKAIKESNNEQQQVINMIITNTIKF